MIEMAIVSIAVCLIFWLLGIKYAVLLGLITGLFNIIPYIGIFSDHVLHPFNDIMHYLFIFIQEYRDQELHDQSAVKQKKESIDKSEHKKQLIRCKIG